MSQQVTNRQVKQYRLTTIIKSLESLISGNKACMTLQNDTSRKLKVTEKIAGNANNILQPRFHSTDKKKGRPRKTPLKRPTEEDIKNLLEQEGHTNPPSAEVATAETSHGSVAPYPPLRLVPPRQQPIQLPTNEEQNLFAVDWVSHLG
ncbi:uncharacterized protein LOC125646320 [Ostrea edulis]|uniref:uncharacterized protein LOC125646320 n=1 Tax=Ostrea edulis TaxID=37623 RepID=UPI0024AF5249|nr:uncharacterized protein LOC125646320 [Ostrea edulis]